MLKMENNCDFLDLLDPDVSSKILMCLDDPTDIIRASVVSRLWHNFVIKGGMCKHLCLRLFPQLAGIAHIIYLRKSQKKSANVGCSRSVEWEYLENEHRVYSSLVRGLTSSEVNDCILQTICASSTDRFPEEGVHNTLESWDRIGHQPSYWSSSGQSNPEVPERLTYKLISDFCVITQINIQPFRAYFQANSPIYSSKAVRFRMGHRIMSDDDGEDYIFGHGGPSAEENFVWTYTSQEFPMAQENRLQNFKLPEPVLCIGGYLQIELLGRAQRQESDRQFYICVAYVQVMGRSLSPIFGAKVVDASGSVSLVYTPLAQLSDPITIPKRPDDVIVTMEMVKSDVTDYAKILIVDL